VDIHLRILLSESFCIATTTADALVVIRPWFLRFSALFPRMEPHIQKSPNYCITFFRQFPLLFQRFFHIFQQIPECGSHYADFSYCFGNKTAKSSASSRKETPALLDPRNAWLPIGFRIGRRLSIMKCRESCGAGLFFRLLDKTHFIADEMTDHALDIWFRLYNDLGFAAFQNGAGMGILEDPSGIAGDHAEFDPVGTAVRAKIRFFLHDHHLVSIIPRLCGIYFRKITV
jgi:hypothetical protein